MPDRAKSNVTVKKWKKPRQQKLAASKARRATQKKIVEGANLIIGMDNGATGTVCAWIPEHSWISFQLTPSKRQQNYQKQTKSIDRVDHQKLKEWISEAIRVGKKHYKSKLKTAIVLQRPMVNPQRFDASLNAVRALEATLIVIQQLQLSYIVIDSKLWQHQFFGKSTIGLDLKLQSLKRGLEQLKKIEGTQKMQQTALQHGDADALMIAKFGVTLSEKPKRC